MQEGRGFEPQLFPRVSAYDKTFWLLLSACRGRSAYSAIGNQLAIDLGFENVVELSDHLVTIMRAFGVKDMLSRYLPDAAQEIYNLKEEMISPGRADNNLRPADFDDIEFLLRQSLESLCV